jgi:hypothetical protein
MGDYRIWQAIFSGVRGLISSRYHLDTSKGPLSTPKTGLLIIHNQVGHLAGTDFDKSPYSSPLAHWQISCGS